MSTARIVSPKSLSSRAVNSLSDQGYTYNQAGFTYNQVGVTYGGVDRNSAEPPINNTAIMSFPKNAQARII